MKTIKLGNLWRTRSVVGVEAKTIREDWLRICDFEFRDLVADRWERKYDLWFERFICSTNDLIYEN